MNHQRSLLNLFPAARSSNRSAIERRTAPGALFLFLAACALSAGSLRAENAIRMGYGEGVPDQTGVDVIVTATNDVPIHAYSIAFAYPAEVLILTDLSISGTHVSLMQPEFVAPARDNRLGVGSLGVIFEYSEPLSVEALPPTPAGGYPRIIARLIFTVKSGAPGGAYPLVLRDGIGTPAGFNRFSDQGTSVVPRLEDGLFVVMTAGNVLQLEKKLAIPGATRGLPIRALTQHPDPLDGFQIAIKFDKLNLTLASATYAGTDLGIILGDPKIELYNYDLDLNFSPTHARATVASIFDFLAPDPLGQQTLPPATASPPRQSLMIFRFDVGSNAAAQAQWQDITLDNAEIPGAIDNRFIVKDQSLDPQRVHGKIHFSTGSLVGRVVDSDAPSQGVAGIKVTTEPDGFEVTAQANGSFRFNDIPPGHYNLKLSDPTNQYYTNRVTVNEAGQPIIVAGNGADTNVGNLPIFKVQAECDTPDCQEPMFQPFLRGYVNADPRIDLSDAIFILLYLFRGGERPRCFLAGDTNDDNKVDLSDGVYLLNYLFGGAASPKAPFSMNRTGCSNDPTPGGTLSCNEFNACI